MQELIGEHSSENLLFLTEAVQWRDRRTGKSPPPKKEHIINKAPLLLLALSGNSVGSSSSIGHTDEDGGAGKTPSAEKEDGGKGKGKETKLGEGELPLIDKLHLPFDHIPTSSALDESLSPFAQAKVLFEKYIKEYSDLEINISYPQRKKLKQMFGGNRRKSQIEKQLKDVLKKSENAVKTGGDGRINPYIFDSAIFEIWRMLTSQFRRYEKEGRIDP